GVLTEIGSFGGLYDLTAAGPFRRPVLVSSTDGVGTKLKVAIQTRNHKTVGMDLVNHCVNDILVQGAVPLFFLDYIAMGKVEGEVMLEVIFGLPSSGLHTNGYSLARKVFFERRSLKPDSPVTELGRTVAEEPLQIHRTYLPALRGLIASGVLYGMAHITGGGFTDNIPRILP